MPLLFLASEGKSSSVSLGVAATGSGAGAGAGLALGAAEERIDEIRSKVRINRTHNNNGFETAFDPTYQTTRQQ